MSNPHELIYANEFIGRLDAAVARFNEYWKRNHAESPLTFPLHLSLINWLDQFQAWLDIDEFELPATLHPEIVEGDPEAKVIPLFKKAVDD